MSSSRTSTAPGASADSPGRRCRRLCVPVAPRLGASSGPAPPAPRCAGTSSRLEMGPDDPAHRVEGGAVAVDQDGEVTGGDRRPVVTTAQRAAASGAKGAGSRRRARVGPRWVDRHLGRKRRIVGILGDQDRVGPGPGADGRPRGPLELRCRLAEDGQDVARLERDQPGALGVVADREDDGHVGKRGSSWPSRATWSTCHAVPSGRRRKGPGAHPGSASANQNVTPDGETQMAGRWARAALEDRPEQAVGGLEGMERGDAREAVQQGAASTAPSDGPGPGRLPVKRSPSGGGAGAPGQRGASERAQAQGDQFGQVSCRLRTWRVVGPVAPVEGRRRAAPRAAGEAPAGSRWSGSTKRTPPPISRPRLTAASAVQSAPSPTRSCAMLQKRLAGPHRVGRLSPPRPRRRPPGSAAGRRRGARRPGACPGASREARARRRWKARGRQRDPCRQAVEERGTRAPTSPGVCEPPPPGGAGRSRRPRPPRPPGRGRTARRASAAATRVRGPPEGVADDRDEHRRDGVKASPGGDRRARDVEEARGDAASASARHRQGRS